MSVPCILATDQRKNLEMINHRWEIAAYMGGTLVTFIFHKIIWSIRNVKSNVSISLNDLNQKEGMISTF